MKWDLQEIQGYIDNQIEENLHLDYKASASLGKNDSKKKEISKDISAMANSDGGVIIYGVSEFDDRSKSHLPEKVDPIVRSDFSKEWLEQIINSNISPRINNVKITPVYTKKDNEVIYVVNIPKSDTAHQAKDKRYYKRYNFESVMMEDYEIKDIINRVKNPKINLEFNIIKEKYGESDVLDVYIEIAAKNDSTVLANYVHCFVEIPRELIKDPDDYPAHEIDGNEYLTFNVNNKKRDIVDHNTTGLISLPKYGTSYYEPILPSIGYMLDEIHFIENFQTVNMNLAVIWRAVSDNSISSGRVLLRDIDISIKISQ